MWALSLLGNGIIIGFIGAAKKSKNNATAVLTRFKDGPIKVSTKQEIPK